MKKPKEKVIIFSLRYDVLSIGISNRYAINKKLFFFRKIF